MTIQQIIDWFKNYKFSTHTVAAVAMAAGTLFKTVPPFHELVMNIYNALPPSVNAILFSAVSLYVWYRDGSVQPIPGIAPKGAVVADPTPVVITVTDPTKKG
jgi:hypothetical protein